jgi:dolichyl-phosphate beta-glucosyltransferase
MAVDLSVVIPAYNEARRVGPTIDAVLDYMGRSDRSYEVIVVDDGSTDETAACVRARSKDHVSLTTLPENRGKGAAVRAGVLASRGERVLFMDADGATAIDEIARLDAACDTGAGIAVGSRWAAGAQVERSSLRALVSWLFQLVLRVLATDLIDGVSDTQCGFKLFRGDLARDLFARSTVDRFAFDVEILALAAKRTRIAEVPVRWSHRPESKVNVVRDGLAMIRDVWRTRRRFGTPLSLAFLRSVRAR